METDTGHKGLAGQIPGLKFNAAATPPVVQSTQIAPPVANAFCTNCGNPVSPQAVACMSCGAKPTGHRRFCRQCGAGLNPEQVVCIKCGAAITALGQPNTVRSAGGGYSSQAQKLDSLFKWFWISLAATLPTCGLGLIPATIFWYMLTYQLWKLIPADIARTTPGKAVGFLFIPYFNIYWCFVAFHGLGKDMNKTLQRYGIQHEVSEGLGLTACWLTLLTGIGVVLMIPFFKSIKEGAILILEQERA